MNRHRTRHSVLSLVVSLGLLLQLIAPLALVPVAQAAAPAQVAAETDGEVAGATTQPAVFSQPLSLSRVQSSYTGGAGIIITYTVTNNQLPTLYPIVPPGATITETLALTAGFDPTADPHTLRDALLATTLTPETALTGAEPAPEQNGRSLAWTLPDIPPGRSAQVVITINNPGSAGQFVDLDGGAAAWAMLYGRAVSAQSAPATLAPEDLAQWLIWTPDADLYDPSMLAQAAELSHDPAELFAFVRGLGYEAYNGSLRGTAGTLWSGAGNSADQASLLIAMLRASGIPARYRHGALAPADAQSLIASMFPAPTQFTGYVPEGTAVANPLQNPTLLAEASDHWWVEAYLPGQGWTNLDPSFAAAASGQSFATPANDGSDRIAELPDDLRHKVRIRLKAENYYPLNIGNGGLASTYPLDFTLNSVEIATQPVAFSHLVDTQGQPGLVFSNIIHTYTPYLLIGEQEPLLGQPYQDVFTNFPLGTIFHTGLWLEFTLLAPDGGSASYERTVADRIGVAARLYDSAGPLNLALSSDTPPFVSPFDIYATGFWPNLVPAGTLAQSRAAALASLGDLNGDAQRLMELEAIAPNLTPEESADLRRIRANFQMGMARYLGDVGLTFAEAADRLLVDSQSDLFVRAYYDSPRLVTAAVQPGEGITPTFTLDLRDTSARVLAYPGQAETAVFGFNMTKGVVESGLEGAALSGALGQTALTTARLFEAATEQGIPSTIITDRNLLWLEQLPYSDEAKARITLAALDGHILIAPQEPVWIDGDYHLGWWQVDALSGETIGVMENGLHLAALEYLFGLGAGSIIGGPMTDFILGFTSYTLGFVADRVDKAIGEGTFDLDAYLWQVGAAATAATCLSALASIIFTFDVWAGGNCGAGAFGAATGEATDFFGLGQNTAKNYLSSVVQYDPPVPQHWQAVAPPDGSQPQASAAVAVAASTTAVSLNATLTTGDLTALGGLNGGWTAAAAHTFPAGSLNANGALRDADGVLLGNGLITAVPATGDSFSLQANPASVALQGNGRFSLYAPALNGLGGGADWGDFSAQLTPSGAMLLTLRGATVSLGGASHSGDFTIETNAPANLSGLGAGAAANFAASANWQATAAQLRLGPATGVATLGGVPLNVSNGLAVAGYDGGLPISQSNATTDQVTLQDNDAHVFTLNLSPESSSAEPLATTTFQTDIFANFGGVYTVTASAPTGWHTQVAANGAISVRPPSGAAPGEYAILVAAQSGQYPDLILTAVHTVSVGSFDGFAFAVEPDNIFTVPMGPVLDPNAVTGSTNTGQAQIPGAAYTIFITNTANAPRTFDVSVSGLPPGWTLLSQSGRATSASLALPPGALGMIGLYVDPNNDALPAPGTTLPFVVTAVSNTGLNQSANLSFTMPGVPFSYVAVEPPMHYVQRGEVTTVTVELSNVGNAAGTFPLTAQAAIPAIAPVGPPQSPFALALGQTAEQVVTLAVGEDAPLGQLFPVWFSSPAPDGVYTQTIATHVWVVDEVVGTILAADACRLGINSYREAVQGLATAVIELQQWCERGNCPLPLRDRVAAAGGAVAGYARAGATPTVLPGVAGLETAVAHLSTQTSNAAILAAVADLSAAVASLGQEVCLAAEYGVNGRFTPSLSVLQK